MGKVSIGLLTQKKRAEKALKQSLIRKSLSKNRRSGDKEARRSQMLQCGVGRLGIL
jgi:hypothetical protein